MKKKTDSMVANGFVLDALPGQLVAATCSAAEESGTESGFRGKDSLIDCQGQSA